MTIKSNGRVTLSDYMYLITSMRRKSKGSILNLVDVNYRKYFNTSLTPVEDVNWVTYIYNSKTLHGIVSGLMYIDKINLAAFPHEIL